MANTVLNGQKDSEILLAGQVLSVTSQGSSLLFRYDSSTLLDTTPVNGGREASDHT